jgi:hypothetical protein
MLFGYYTLFVALLIEVVGAYYSITGLAAIFSGAVVPILIMGGSLELGKVTAAVWLKNNWHRASLQFKLYLLPAVVMLMLITSMGIFGFLSKAHNDQTLVSGDVGSKLAIYDEKIKTARENIEADRKQLAQMDAAVDQVMSRSSDEKGADKANAIRNSQKRDRTALARDIENNQTVISRLNDEAAPIRAENRKVEAEVGPIKYIAKLIYEDNPDANILEKAVTWVIMIIVAVFDPLALVLILAAQQSIRWADGEEPKPVGPTFAERLESIRNRFKKKEDKDDTIDESQMYVSTLPQDEPVVDQAEVSEEYFRSMDPVEQKAADDAPHDEYFADSEPDKELPVEEPVEETEKSDPLAHIVVPEIDRNEDPLHHMAKVMWHAANPDDDHRLHHALHQAGEIDKLPWHTEDHINSLAISDGEKKQLIARFANTPPVNTAPPAPEPTTKFVEIDALKIKPDNVPGQTGEVKGFGTQFPATANKGDMFIRVDQLPSVLYKFNGNLWIEVDKELTDSHAYDEAYIDHLISKIESGEYDPELLSDAEQASIERRLSDSVRGI